MFVADGLGIGVGSDFTIEPAAGIFTARFARQRQSPFPEAFLEESLVESSQISDLANAQTVQVLFRDFTDTGNVSHVERSQKFCFLSGHDPKNPVRFVSG